MRTRRMVLAGGAAALTVIGTAHPQGASLQTIAASRGLMFGRVAGMALNA